jgi:hypothetical protein
VVPGSAESAALGMSLSAPHEEIRRAPASRKTLSSFKIPFMAKTKFMAGILEKLNRLQMSQVFSGSGINH